MGDGVKFPPLRNVRSHLVRPLVCEFSLTSNSGLQDTHKLKKEFDRHFEGLCHGWAILCGLASPQRAQSVTALELISKALSPTLAQPGSNKELNCIAMVISAMVVKTVSPKTQT
jgi:hypothetical protein